MHPNHHGQDALRAMNRQKKRFGCKVTKYFYDSLIFNTFFITYRQVTSRHYNNHNQKERTY